MVAEDVYLGRFATLDGTAWPAGFRCTATDTDTGDLVVWDQGSGVLLLRAVAASCSVPVLFPAVTIKGPPLYGRRHPQPLERRGGAARPTFWWSCCHPLASQGAGGGASIAASVTLDAELAPLRETRRLVAAVPDFSDIEAPANMMDPNLAIEAFQIGKRQAEREATAIQAAWNF